MPDGCYLLAGLPSTFLCARFFHYGSWMVPSILPSSWFTCWPMPLAFLPADYLLPSCHLGLLPTLPLPSCRFYSRFCQPSGWTLWFWTWTGLVLAVLLCRILPCGVYLCITADLAGICRCSAVHGWLPVVDTISQRPSAVLRNRHPGPCR